ncbi:MAG TPA: hypothetical protein VHE13_10410 [Opitutus sp.]|nr:hypothetical protein [Opitutus sp.]
MLGLVAVAGLAPRWLVKGAPARSTHAQAAQCPVAIRPDARAVSRQADSL